MGCGSSKKVPRANSLPRKSTRPVPRVIEEMLLTNSHNQFVALICKINNVTKKFVPAEPVNRLPFIIKDNEGERLKGVETHVRVDFDLQSEILSKEKIWKEHKAAQRQSEKIKASEEDKIEIINTWELMEGLDDEETCHVSQTMEKERDTLSFNRSDMCQELIDQSLPRRISGRSKSLESFHTVEEYDGFLARRKRPFWDRNSKMLFYYLGSTSLSIRLSSWTQLSCQGRNMAPIVIDWKEDSKDEDDTTLEFSVLPPSIELRDMKHHVDHQVNKDIPQTVSENNGIAQTVSENNGRQENNHSVERNIGSTNMVEANSEKDQSLQISKKRIQVRAKLNDLGGIIIPTSPFFSAVGSLKEWLHDGEHIYSPDEFAIPRISYSGFGDIWSKLNVSGSSRQPSSDEAELETYYFPVSTANGRFANNGESSIYFQSGDSAKENKQEDDPSFDPQFQASLDKDLEQLSREEKHLLRQTDGDSNLLCGKLYAKGNDDGLQDSSGTVDTHVQGSFPCKEQEFSIQDLWTIEVSQEVLATF